MQQRTEKISTSVLIAATLGGIIWASAGDLNSPHGPVTSTMMTLAEIEPHIPIGPNTTPGDNDSVYKITTIGSFYLTDNVFGAAGQMGIEIAASNVTIDLNGFVVPGLTFPPGQTLDGIRVTQVGAINIIIHNGIFTSWGQHGVDTFAANDCRLENLNVSNNSSRGINAGSGALIRGVVASSNTGVGISCESGTIDSCTALQNGTGIRVNFAGAIRNCSARQNVTDGITAQSDSSVTNCITTHNGANGINVTTSTSISNCTASFNAGDGIIASSRCKIVGNLCNANGFNGDGAGIHVTGNSNSIDGNHLTSNDCGLVIDDTINLFTRNTFVGNTNNFTFIGGNLLGSIVTTQSEMVNSNAFSNFSL